MNVTTLQQRRNSATRWFWARVILLLALAGGIAYAAWLAPWAKPARRVRTEIETENGTAK